MTDGKKFVSRVVDSRYFVPWVFGFGDFGSDFNAGFYRIVAKGRVKMMIILCLE